MRTTPIIATAIGLSLALVAPASAQTIKVDPRHELVALGSNQSMAILDHPRAPLYDAESRTWGRALPYSAILSGGTWRYDDRVDTKAYVTEPRFCGLGSTISTLALDEAALETHGDDTTIDLTVYGTSLLRGWGSYAGSCQNPYAHVAAHRTGNELVVPFSLTGRDVEIEIALHTAASRAGNLPVSTIGGATATWTLWRDVDRDGTVSAADQRLDTDTHSATWGNLVPPQITSLSPGPGELVLVMTYGADATVKTGVVSDLPAWDTRWNYDYQVDLAITGL